jgi:Recombination endonuclease VII
MNARDRKKSTRKTHCKNGHPRTPENLFANNSCKECGRIQTAAWQQANPDKVKVYNERRQLKKTPEGSRAYELLRKYGLSYECYLRMLTEQHGRCAICQRLMDAPKVDHDHETGIVRQLLCNECNAGIGFLREDTNIIESALKYLRRWGKG